MEKSVLSVSAQWTWLMLPLFLCLRFWSLSSPNSRTNTLSCFWVPLAAQDSIGRTGYQRQDVPTIVCARKALLDSVFSASFLLTVQEQESRFQDDLLLKGEVNAGMLGL